MFREAFVRRSSSWLKTRRPFLQVQRALSWSQFFPCTHRDLRWQRVAPSSVLRAFLRVGVLKRASFETSRTSRIRTPRLSSSGRTGKSRTCSHACAMLCTLSSSLLAGSAFRHRLPFRSSGTGRSARAVHPRPPMQLHILRVEFRIAHRWPSC